MALRGGTGLHRAHLWVFRNYATTHRTAGCFWTRKSTSPCYIPLHLDFLCNYNFAVNQNHHQKTESRPGVFDLLCCARNKSSSCMSKESCIPATAHTNLVKLLTTKWRTKADSRAGHPILTVVWLSARPSKNHFYCINQLKNSCKNSPGTTLSWSFNFFLLAKKHLVTVCLSHLAFQHITRECSVLILELDYLLRQRRNNASHVLAPCLPPRGTLPPPDAPPMR